jgi:hypothetical protein
MHETRTVWGGMSSTGGGGSGSPLQGGFNGASVATPVPRQPPLHISSDFISKFVVYVDRRTCCSPSSEYSSRLQTSQQPHGSSYGTTRTQATETTPANRSDHEISRVNVCMLLK